MKRITRRQLRKMIITETQNMARSPSEVLDHVLIDLEQAYEKDGIPGFIMQLAREYTIPMETGLKIMSNTDKLMQAYDKRGIDGLLNFIIKQYDITRKS